MRFLRTHAPGIGLVVAIAAIARFTSPFLPKVLGEVLVAIVLGLVIANLFTLPKALSPGVQWSVKMLLRAGIVLLGARLMLADVLKIGGAALGVVVVLIALALLLAVSLGKLLRLPPRLCLLIGVGTAICGNTAIVTSAPAIGAEEKEVSFAVATITLFGMIAVFFYPMIGAALAMTPQLYGAWCGLAINDTSQVVAASAAYDAAALDVATVVKLVRNALMAPVVVGLAIWARKRKGARDIADAPTPPSPVPAFVVGFLVLAALRTAGVIDAEVASLCEAAAKALILCALAGVGLSTRIADLRHTGAKPLLLGLTISVLLSSLALLAVRFFV